MPKYAGGRPPTFTLPERREIKKVALSRPVDHGLPFSTWSLTKLAEFLVAEGVVDVTDTRTLDTHIRRLRMKLERDPTNPCFLVTVRGVGFRFEIAESAQGQHAEGD